MDWDELYARGINVENISRDSKEYDAMFSAAVRKIPSAQYCLGLWTEKVNKKPNIALIWLKKAERQNFKEATPEIGRIERLRTLTPKTVTMQQSSDPQTADIVHDHIETNTQPTSLVIRDHDFQEAKNALKRFTERERKDIELDRVDYDGGFLWLGNHKVTGRELNNIISQIQKHLVDLNQLNLGLIEEFGQVYKAFESLDKDYISGIVASIKATEEVSKQEQKDRKDIKELVAQHEVSVAVLKKFKADIDKLKHLTDIDRLWELIEEQSRLLKELGSFITDLSNVKHLKDVDNIHTDFEALKKDFLKVSDLQSKYATELIAVRNYCDTLSTLQHIKDIDKLWDNNESALKDIQSIKKSLEDQKQAISDLQEVLKHIQEAQQHFIDNINRLVSDTREDINNQFRLFTEAQTAKLEGIDRTYTEAIDKLSIEQREKLSSIEKSLGDSIDSAVQEQSSVINQIKKVQEEKLAQLFASQSSTLEQLANDQSSKLEEIDKSLEEEKAALNEQVSALTQKVKFLYIVAGGATALTVIQLLFNILGVF